MTANGKTLGEIGRAWGALRDVLARVPRGRMEEAGVEGSWSVKDLIGHVSTWEGEAMGSIGRYLRGRDLAQLAWIEDIDGFNASSVEGGRSTPLADVLDDFEKTHADLVRFVEGIGEDARGVPEVETRIRVDTFDHYEEHAATIRQWLERVAL